MKHAVSIFLLGAVVCLGCDTRTPSYDDSTTETGAAAVAEAMAAICPQSELTRAEDGTVTGCRVCLPGMDFENERGFEWELRRATFGHFTAASADNLILSGIGCESHSSNFGGSLLFVLQSGKPQLMTYHKALITENCQKLRLQDGRDFLVCEHEWGGQGWAWSFVWSVVFHHPGNSEISALFTTEDSLKTCGEDPEGDSRHPVQHSTIQSIRFPDLNGDGLADMSIRATLGKKLLTETERQACVRAVNALEPPPVRIPTKEYQIDFLFDGKQFHVAPASKNVIALFPTPRFPN
ncbi:MAG: hypothetical protein ACE5H2_02555 [Terriglobia bacterium]